MPNHCYQSVFLRGEPKEIDRLYEAVKEQKFLNAVIPDISKPLSESAFIAAAMSTHFGDMMPSVLNNEGRK